MRPSILLVNPPIYDFSAYDFWLKPYGLLRVAGFLRNQAEFHLIDFLDRLDSRVPAGKLSQRSLGSRRVLLRAGEEPSVFAGMPRQFRRYGLPPSALQDLLASRAPFDYALVQTGMTYWYLGVGEVVREIRRLSPLTKIILGGVYATLCPAHARSLGIDLVVEGSDLSPLWQFLSMEPDEDQLLCGTSIPSLKPACSNSSTAARFAALTVPCRRCTQVSARARSNTPSPS